MAKLKLQGVPLKAKLIIFFLHLFSYLPLPWVHKLGDIIAWFMMRVKNRARATTQTNLAFCFPEYNEQALHSKTQESLAETSKLMLEMGHIWLKPIDQVRGLVVKVKGEHLLSEAKAADKGIIVLAPHLGNWEILGNYLSAQLAMTNLYSPPDDTALDEFIQKARRRDGSELVATDRKGIATLIKRLKAKKATGILPDQEPLTEGGVFVPFFGQPALTMTLLPGLLKRSNAVVLAAFARRLPKGKGFEVIIEPVSDDIYADNIEVSATAMNRAVEQLIAHAPAQYQWEYKRFKRQPDKKVIYQAGI